MAKSLAWVGMGVFIFLSLIYKSPVIAADGDPTIVWGPIAGTIHLGTADGDQQYGLNLRIQVDDPRGVENIESVLVTAPDLTTVYILYDDGDHCDGGPNDGVYARECGGSDTSQPQMGTYTFTITNKNDPPQSITQTASVSTIMDLPTNPSPSNYAFVDTATPTFTWGSVNSAISYNLDVRDSDGFQPMWGVGDVSGTSIVYNADGSGNELKAGKIYQWGVGAQDGQGNSSWYHTSNTFVYSVTGEPVLSRLSAGTSHIGTVGGGQQYGLNLRVQVADAQGLENIASVLVTAPDSTTVYTLYDDGNHCDEGPNDGYYSHECGGSDSHLPQMGTYTFTITNKNDPPQSVSQTANISTILDLPANLFPTNGTFVDTATPTFTWGPVNGALFYNLNVNDSDDFQLMWSDGNVTSTSIVYNADGSGSDLQTGKVYQWGVGAHDGLGNSSWYYSPNGFVYSTTGEPVLTRLEAGTIHLGTADGDQQYGLNLRVQVTDAQGLENIASVLVTAPDSTTVYPLYDDGNHCDDGPNDGYYSRECGGSSSIQPQMGTYTFTITNKNDPPLSVSHSVNISTILDLPTNPSPSNGAFVDTATPTLTWGPVNGATSYNLEVRNSDDFQQMWHFENITDTSIVYNADGNGSDLQTGKIYQWGVGANDGQGNSSWFHTSNTFVYSTTGEPVLNRLQAGTIHVGTTDGDQQYGLNLRVQVSDAQGLENIASVLVTAPDSTTVYTLYDDGNHCDEGPNDGYYARECGGSSSIQPQMGTYTFTITNKNDPPLSVSHSVNISTILDLPTNPSPSNGAFIDTATPTFTWGPVNGATSYNLDVRSSDHFQQMWHFENITDTSIVYNADGNGSDLQTGKIYQWGVGARDDQGNSSWYHTSNVFNYSTGEPVLGRQNVGGNVRVMDGANQYAVHLSVEAADPLGLGNIQSVTVNDEFGHSYVLFDDGQHADNAPNDGTFGIWLEWNSSPYSTGTYSFTAINSDGLSTSVTDVLEDFLEPVSNFSPTSGSAIFSQIPTFSWESPGLTNARISLSNYRDSSEYWADQNITASSKIYDGPTFEEGIPYRWSLGVFDDLGNSVQVDNQYFIYYPTRRLVDTWYDRFDDEYINRYKWMYWDKDMVREIRNGQLQLNIAGDSFGVNRMDLRLIESEALDYLQARVMVENGSQMSSGAIGYARVAGYFYNDSRDGSLEKPYDGYLDDIWVELKIVLDDQGQLKLNSYMERSVDTLGNEGSLLLNEDWAMPIEFDTFYTLSVQMDWDNAQIIFKCNDETYTYPILTSRYKPYGREYKLRTRLYASGDMKSSMRTRYDDVVIDKGAGQYLYEDFTSPTIDMTKWQDKEDAKEIENGAMRLVVRGLNVSDNITNYIAPVFRSSYMEAKVSLESGSIMNGTRGIARLNAQFYNDTYGEGSQNPVYQGDEGQIFSTVYLQMNPDNTLVAKAYVERANDPEWNESTTLMNSTFTTPIELDRQYRISVELKDNQLIFKCDEEKIVYPITTDIYPSRTNWLALTSRIYSGTDGLIKARFDDVRLWKRDYGLDDIITILNASAGANPQAIKDIDDFTNDMHIDVTDAISILQYVAGMRNWP